VLSLLVVSVSAQPPTGVLGVWRDVNPTAYLNPPADPPLNSVYMLSATEGWAVGDFEFTIDTTHAFPAMLHYDGATWTLVPVPKNPTDPDIPAGYTLNSVSFGPPGQPISRLDGWAVGSGFGGQDDSSMAVALHWDGTTWKDRVSGLTGPDAGPLQSVFMVSPTDVWAVGSNEAGTDGRFWHWTGTAGLGGGWSLQGSAPGNPLFSVFMLSSAEGWAVGAGGAIYHYFGGTWTGVSSPVSGTTTLRSIFMISPTEGWAVGDDGVNPVHAVIIHYTGGIWTGPFSPGTAGDILRSVFMVSSTEGWAVGDAGTIVHYTAGTWTALPVNMVPTLPATAFAFNSVFFNSASDAWAVGSAGVFLHYDGVNWGTVTSPSLTELTSISFGPPLAAVDPNDAWAVGRTTSSVEQDESSAIVEPTIIHWNGFMWTKGIAIGTTNDLFSVFKLSNGDVWAVGGGRATTATCTTLPCPVILHFTGGAWNTITPPAGSYMLTSVFMVNPNEGWAVGCTGTSEQCAPSPGLPRVSGGGGIILHYTVTGGVATWGIFPAPTSPAAPPGLNSIFMLSSTEGWAVGDAATVLHYTVTGGAGSWNVVSVTGLPTQPPANLNSIFLLSPTNAWAVGGNPMTGPAIIHWDGTHWTAVAPPTIPGIALPPIPSTLKSIYCTGASDCWAVGDRQPDQLVATILHWDGIAWTHITLAPSLLGFPFLPPILNSIYMITSSNGWIVGSSPNFLPSVVLPPILIGPLSTILRFSPFGGLLTVTSTSTVVSTVTQVATAYTSLLTTSNLSSSTSTIATATTSPIPAFPVESIITGFILGLIALTLLRRRRADKTA
jgi:hypothetical protein